MDIENTIISVLKEQGPLLPVDIAKNANLNTWVISAILADLKKENKINQSKSKIGASSLYYLPEHKDKLFESVLSHTNPEIKAKINQVKSAQVIFDDELSTEDKAHFKEYPDLIEDVEVNLMGTHIICWKWWSVADEEVLSFVKTKLSKFKNEYKQPEPEQQLKPIIDVESVEGFDFSDDAMEKKTTASLDGDKLTNKMGNIWPGSPIHNFLQILSRNKIKVITKDEIEKNKKYQLHVELKTVFGHQHYIIILKNSETPVGVTELIDIFMEGLEEKIPIVFVSSSGFTEKAVQYQKNNMRHFIHLLALEDFSGE